MLQRETAEAVERFELRPIGYIRCDHKEPSATPIQPVYAQECRARAEIFPEYEEGLRDLEGFSHIYIIYYFHKGRPPSLTVTPFLEDVARGVFATRSPRRPNPIGFSLVRLVKRENNILFLEEEDMLDGTPVLDIKPFVPRFDYRDNARAGWQEDVDEETAKVRGRREAAPANPQIMTNDKLAVLRSKAELIERHLGQTKARIQELEREGAARPRRVAVIDGRKCIGCGMCAKACPTGAIIVAAIAVVDTRKCTGCGRCVEACQSDAIRLS
jgi:tRNA-Thr(GGU) m(6)t(6)A37 methyltransferase TsaA